MTTQEQNNKLIADFMAYPGDNNKSHFYYAMKHCYDNNLMQYDTSWDWLMPVVEKTELLGFQFFIHNEGAYMKKWFWKGNFPDYGNVGENKIEGAYKTVVQFIQWYNQSTSKTVSDGPA